MLGFMQVTDVIMMIIIITITIIMATTKCNLVSRVAQLIPFISGFCEISYVIVIIAVIAPARARARARIGSAFSSRIRICFFSPPFFSLPAPFFN